MRSMKPTADPGSQITIGTVNYEENSTVTLDVKDRGGRISIAVLSKSDLTVLIQDLQDTLNEME
jgi:hypothetical protein